MNAGEEISSIKNQLLNERRVLLDLSTRNRLLNVPLRTRNVRTIEIVDEKSDVIYHLLSEGKSLSFLAGRQLKGEERAGLDEGDIETGGIPQPPENDTVDEHGVARRYTDLRLQTKLTSEGLQKRLFDIWADARTLEEEQGVNILYLALGLLRWYENDSSDIPRHAPIILLPVRLDRANAADRFKLKLREEPPSPNLSLQAKMKAEFSILVDDFSDEDSIDLPAYFSKISEVISTQKRWEVLPDAMVLGFFSFAKFLMYRDLAPDAWPAGGQVDHHPFIAALLRDGFPENPGLIDDNDDHSNIDALIPPHNQSHVVDADSSQSVAIHEAANGRSIVVKGPPGTGKSQTIANIIAAAVANGKKVLFVAEKMAALNVVHRRLKQQAGLGALLLELHSNKTNKKAVLEELRRTRDLKAKPADEMQSIIEKLSQAQGLLNSHARALNEKQKPFELSPQQILGHLTRLSLSGSVPTVELEAPNNWTPADVEERRALVQELSERIASLGAPYTHPWRGVERDALTPNELDSLGQSINRLSHLLETIQAAAETASSELGATVNTLADHALALAYFDAAVKLPLKDWSSLNHEAWISQSHTLSQFVSIGIKAKESGDAVRDVFVDAAWDTDFAPIREIIATKGNNLFRFLDGRYRSALSLLRSYLKADLPKAIKERII